MANKRFAVFDSDSHVVEPSELWSKYLDPEFRTLGKFALWREEGKLGSYLKVNGKVFRDTMNSNIPRYAIWRPGAPDGVGDIHRGRVIARVPAMAGAFVALDGAEGFLPDSDGGAAKTKFEVVAAGTAVMETISPTGMGMEDMLTLYSIDGDSIVLVHYCPTNNQPRMKATPGTGDVKELTFAFQGAGNLPSEETGHQHKLVIQFEDADHITETWTWRSKGKDTPMVFHFTRKKN